MGIPESPLTLHREHLMLHPRCVPIEAAQCPLLAPSWPGNITPTFCLVSSYPSCPSSHPNSQLSNTKTSSNPQLNPVSPGSYSRARSPSSQFDKLPAAQNRTTEWPYTKFPSYKAVIPKAFCSSLGCGGYDRNRTLSLFFTRNLSLTMNLSLNVTLALIERDAPHANHDPA